MKVPKNKCDKNKFLKLKLQRQLRFDQKRLIKEQSVRFSVIGVGSGLICSKKGIVRLILE